MRFTKKGGSVLCGYKWCHKMKAAPYGDPKAP
jgi:hypothetical protein